MLCNKNAIKIENSLEAIFDEVQWAIIVYGLWSIFEASLKISKKLNFDQTQFKLGMHNMKNK